MEISRITYTIGCTLIHNTLKFRMKMTNTLRVKCIMFRYVRKNGTS